MPEQRRMTITSSPHLAPDDVARHTFASVRRGFDPTEVRDYLESIATGLRALSDREHELVAALADAEVIEKSGGIGKIREILKKTISDRPGKVIFGSDWPMCKIEDHIKLVKSLGLSKNVEDKIFSGNVAKIYKLKILLK